MNEQDPTPFDLASTQPLPLRRTPLWATHKALGGEFVEFGGWDMPVQYKGAGLVAEHLATRARVGLFDVSHMGEFLVEGPEAIAVANRLVTNDIGSMRDGQACYAALCDADGHTVDDVFVYRIGPRRVLIVVNASNADKDYEHVISVATGDAVITNASSEFAQIALQGPAAHAVLEAALPGPILHAPRNRVGRHEGKGPLSDAEIWVATTGYTGEPGYELYCPPTVAAALWASLMSHGEAHGIAPVGLGARDTLRLEAGYCLYGHELSPVQCPLEAGIGWAVKLTPDKGDFVGRAAIEARKAAGLARKRIGVEMEERGIPRQDYAIFAGAEGGAAIGAITSGTQSPSLKRPIGMAYVASDRAVPGTPVFVEVHGKRRRARVVKPVFYTTQAT